MVNTLGMVTGKRSEANTLSMKIVEEFENLKVYVHSLQSTGKKVLYYIWKDPDTVAG